MCHAYCQALCLGKKQLGKGREMGKGGGGEHVDKHPEASLLASSPVWASKTGLARTRERAAKPRGAEDSAPHSRVLARLASLAQIGELARRLSGGRFSALL